MDDPAGIRHEGDRLSARINEQRNLTGTVMYLRDLAVFAAGRDDPADVLRKRFNRSTHAVVELVLAWIPRRTVVLDNLGKLNVAVGNASGAVEKRMRVMADVRP